jgi:hypothetical protein
MRVENFHAKECLMTPVWNTCKYKIKNFLTITNCDDENRSVVAQGSDKTAEF